MAISQEDLLNQFRKEGDITLPVQSRKLVDDEKKKKYELRSIKDFADNKKETLKIAYMIKSKGSQDYPGFMFVFSKEKDGTISVKIEPEIKDDKKYKSICKKFRDRLDKIEEADSKEINDVIEEIKGLIDGLLEKTNEVVGKDTIKRAVERSDDPSRPDVSDNVTPAINDNDTPVSGKPDNSVEETEEDKAEDKIILGERPEYKKESSDNAVYYVKDESLDVLKRKAELLGKKKEGKFNLVLEGVKIKFAFDKEGKISLTETKEPPKTEDLQKIFNALSNMDNDQELPKEQMDLLMSARETIGNKLIELGVKGVDITKPEKKKSVNPELEEQKKKLEEEKEALDKAIEGIEKTIDSKIMTVKYEYSKEEIDAMIAAYDEDIKNIGDPEKASETDKKRLDSLKKRKLDLQLISKKMEAEKKGRLGELDKSLGENEEAIKEIIEGIVVPSEFEKMVTRYLTENEGKKDSVEVRIEVALKSLMKQKEDSEKADNKDDAESLSYKLERLEALKAEREKLSEQREAVEKKPEIKGARTEVSMRRKALDGRKMQEQEARKKIADLKAKKENVTLDGVDALKKEIEEAQTEVEGLMQTSYEKVEELMVESMQRRLHIEPTSSDEILKTINEEPKDGKTPDEIIEAAVAKLSTPVVEGKESFAEKVVRRFKEFREKTRVNEEERRKDEYVDKEETKEDEGHEIGE